MARGEGEKVRFVRSKRDLENLLRMHSNKKGYTVRVKSLHGIQSARVMLERRWIVKGLDHLDALVELHYMIANSASLMDEVISRTNAHLLGGHTPTIAYENPGAILHDPTTSSTVQDSAHLISGDNSASGYQSSAAHKAAVLPDDGESTLTLHDSSARGKSLVLGDNPASGNQSSGERKPAILTDRASTSPRRQDSAQGKYLVLSDRPASGYAESGRQRTSFVGAATHHPATPRSDRASTDVHGGANRERVTLHPILPFDGHPSLGRRAVGDSGSYFVDTDTDTGSGGSLRATINPTFFDSACYNLDLAVHRLFVSGTTLRSHQVASPSIQLIVQALGREIEEVAYALQDARHPPKVLLEELKRVKVHLHEVWALRVPSSEFKLL